MTEDKVVTLKLIDFNESDIENLKTILGLAERALKKKWRLVETDDADFFLLSIIAATEKNRANI